VGLLRNKLKEVLDLDQGNHSMFDYTRQFNTLAQYGSYHVDTDEKKANLFRYGLTIQLQECLVQSPQPILQWIGECRHWSREDNEGRCWGWGE
jgi:hypothetical protein